jgi:hypothetical protein
LGRLLRRFPDPIRGEINRLRKLRNELVHDGLGKDAVSKQLAGELLCATVFGFEYLRYAESSLLGIPALPSHKLATAPQTAHVAVVIDVKPAPERSA